MFVSLLSLFAAFLIGFSLHRASICSVAAVGEILSTQRVYLLATFIKTILWVQIIGLIMLFFYPQDFQVPPLYSASLMSVTGGFIFGIGAAINNGCALSTITKLAEGQVRLLMSLPGFILGVIVYLGSFTPPQAMFQPRFAMIAGNIPPTIITMLFSGWVVWQLFTLSTLFRNKRPNLQALVFSKRYRLSAAAAIIGICNGYLYYQHGSWTYTSALIDTVLTHDHFSWPLFETRVILFIALFLGALISARRNKRFSLKIRPDTGWISSFIGGFIMGIGAMMVPGSNDVLILQGLAHLSPHALPAFFSMIAGIGITLLIRQRITRKSMRINCSGDFCRMTLITHSH